MRFSVTIDLGNDAMQNGFEVAESLEGIAERIRGIYDIPHHIESGGEIYGRAYDLNGNPVGQWVVEA